MAVEIQTNKHPEQNVDYLNRNVRIFLVNLNENLHRNHSWSFPFSSDAVLVCRQLTQDINFFPVGVPA